MDRNLNGFEIGFYRRKSGVDEERLQAACQNMEESFLKQEAGLIEHKMVRLQDNLYADITIAIDKETAQAICHKWLLNPQALAFLELIDPIQFEGLEIMNFGEIL